jgi:hypothetical protein
MNMLTAILFLLSTLVGHGSNTFVQADSTSTTRAKPNDVTGNHPGTQWDGKPHIHIPGAGSGGHVPVEPGVRPR